MRIIGIDPGTGILGFGVIDAVGAKTTLVTAGCKCISYATRLTPCHLKGDQEGFSSRHVRRDHHDLKRHRSTG